MRQSKHITQLQLLQHQVYFKASDAKALGIPVRMLAHFCQQGMIERVCRGLYRGIDADSGLDLGMEDLVLTAASIPNGVVCLSSALYLYEMTDQILREYWIAVPNADKSPKRPHTRIVRMRNMTLGTTTLQLGAHTLKIFDRERTVVDAFRFLSDEIAIKALQAYLAGHTHKPDLAKLSAYAKTMKVNLSPYLMALTT